MGSSKLRVQRLAISSILFLSLFGCAEGFRVRGENSGSSSSRFKCENPGAEIPTFSLAALTQTEVATIGAELIYKAVPGQLYGEMAKWTPIATNFDFDNYSPLIADKSFATDRLAAAKILAAEALKSSQVKSCNESHDDCFVQIISEFAERAWRRPLEHDEQDRLLDLFQGVKAKAVASPAKASLKSPFDEGLEASLIAVLASPNFHLKVVAPPNNTYKGEYTLSSHEMASRLAMFITGGLPDQELRELADQGLLQQPGVLRQQAKRLLSTDYGVSTFTKRFAGQWLRFRDQLGNNKVLVNQGPTFDELAKESQFVFEVALKENLPIGDLIQPGFTMVNPRLATYYNLPMADNGFNKVMTTERGGLLQQGNLLVNSAFGDETKPIRRGAWVLDKLMCEELPPINAAAQNVIDESLERLKDLPVDEMLRAHREDESCNICHYKMDPIGLGLENFDAFGMWRTKYDDGRPVKSQGELLGESFSNSTELSQVISGSPQVKNCIKKKIASFATGQNPYAKNGCTLNKINSGEQSGTYGIQDAILNLVETEAFRKVRFE